MELMVKMAILQTILDAVKLFESLRTPESSGKIDDMILRLTTMGKSL